MEGKGGGRRHGWRGGVCVGGCGRVLSPGGRVRPAAAKQCRACGGPRPVPRSTPGRGGGDTGTRRAPPGPGPPGGAVGLARREDAGGKGGLRGLEGRRAALAPLPPWVHTGIFYPLTTPPSQSLLGVWSRWRGCPAAPPLLPCLQHGRGCVCGGGSWAGGARCGGALGGVLGASPRGLPQPSARRMRGSAPHAGPDIPPPPWPSPPWGALRPALTSLVPIAAVPTAPAPSPRVGRGCPLKPGEQESHSPHLPPSDGAAGLPQRVTPTEVFLFCLFVSHFWRLWGFVGVSDPPERGHFKSIPLPTPPGSSMAREPSGVTGRKKFCGAFLKASLFLRSRLPAAGLDRPAAAASPREPKLIPQVGRTEQAEGLPVPFALRTARAASSAQRCIALPTSTDVLSVS